MVEFGSGYTTLFLLRALADNAADIPAERVLLQEKANAHASFLAAASSPSGGERALGMWVATGGAAWGLDPAYYLQGKDDPRLYSFEERAADDPYVRAMQRAVEDVGHQNMIEHLTSSRFRLDSIPPDRLPIGLAWNDHHSYRDFFQMYWEALNPAGGLLVLHNVAGHRELWDDLEWIRRQRDAAADFEVLILPEPHKLHQNSCAILRRVTGYQPTFRLEQPAAVAHDLQRLLDEAASDDE